MAPSLPPMLSGLRHPVRAATVRVVHALVTHGLDPSDLGPGTHHFASEIACEYPGLDLVVLKANRTVPVTCFF
jgi:hypothetical protein